MVTGAPPPGLFERARLLRDGLITPVGTRDAATVALLRDAPGGPEVYLLRRVRGMAFAGGMYVFPGGSVDPADAVPAEVGPAEVGPAEVGRAGRFDSAPDRTWAGPSPARWAADFSCDEPLARALVCAAVRETFEESGVLLAGAAPVAGAPSTGPLPGVLADVSSDEWEAERAALEAREQSLSELLVRRSLVLRADLLRPLAHWITPEVEAKRFDTLYFVARMPIGQVCREVGGEADQRVWVRPEEALTDGLRMLPPTAVALRDLAEHADVDSALAAVRTIVAVLPKLVSGPDDQVAFLLPGDPGYPG